MSTYIKAFILLLCYLLSYTMIGCSQESATKGSTKERYVPRSAQEITSSSKWKLDYTTKAGIKCYVQTVSREVQAKLANDFDHPDYEYLQEPSDAEQPAYFLVMIRGGEIVDELKPEESGEILGYILKKDKGFSDALREMAR